MNDHLYNRDAFYVGGKWVPPAGTERLDVISPSSEEVVGGVPVATTEDIDRAVDAAGDAFENGPWPRMSPAERSEVLGRVAELAAKHVDEIAAVTVDEIGCPVSNPGSQTAMVAPVFQYYADLARSFEFERLVRTDTGAGVVDHVPVGVVGAIVPWNSPCTLATWKSAPALAAGCTVVLKPPPESPLSPMILADIMDEAGVPAGVFNVVPGDREVGENLVTHRGIDKIAFTGSTAAGKRIMSLCGDQVKRVSLELGGKSAAIVLDDADVADVVPKVVGIGMNRSGQVCAAQTRILVPRSRYAEALEAAGAAASAIPVGDARDPATVIGPLVAQRQRDRVEGYVASAREQGATVVTGGGRPVHLAKGWFFEPTVLGDVSNEMTVAREEIFGPVLSIIPFDDEDDAVRIANDSAYGLAGGVWSADPAHALRVARRLRTGAVNINASYPPFPAVPFGGFKESGLGRELGTEGLLSYLEVRSIGIPADLAGSAVTR